MSSGVSLPSDNLSSFPISMSTSSALEIDTSSTDAVAVVAATAVSSVLTAYEKSICYAKTLGILHHFA